MAKSFRMWLAILIQNFMYYVGWFIDNIFLTLFNFAICIPISYLIWFDGSYWSPIERKQISNSSFYVPVTTKVVGSLVSVGLVFAIVGCICNSCEITDKVILPIAIACALAVPTLSFIIRFCIKAVKRYRLVKTNSHK